MLIPYKINTLFQHTPFVNWILMAFTALVSLYFLIDEPDWMYNLALQDWNPVGIVGHILLHADLFHLIGNLIFLWVFGNAINGNAGHLAYLLLYLAFGVAGGIAHLLFDSGLAVGASGAINGVIGMATAMYPRNQVSVFWLFLIKAGTFEIPLWGLALIWLIFDIIGAIVGSSGVAVWAHLGGFAAGIATGLILLRCSIVTLTQWDNESLDQILFP